MAQGERARDRGEIDSVKVNRGLVVGSLTGFVASAMKLLLSDLSNTIFPDLWNSSPVSLRSPSGVAYIILHRAIPFSNADCNAVVSMQNAPSSYMVVALCCCTRLSLCDLKSRAKISWSLKNFPNLDLRC